MTVLVDEPRWEWQGSRWAHLVSDHSYDELHDFAAGLGKRRLGFQGDHYDVDHVDHGRAVALGAVQVASRELVRRLRAAGLRNRTDKPLWRRVAEWPPGVDLGRLDGRLHRALTALDLDPRPTRSALFHDPRRWCLLLDLPPDLPGPPPGTVRNDVDVHVGGPRHDGWRSVEIFAARAHEAYSDRAVGAHR